MFLPQRFHALQWAISLEYQTGFSLYNFPIFLCLETIYKFPFFYGETCFNTTFNTSLCYKEFLLKWEQSAQIIIAVKSYDSNDHLLGTYIFSRLLMHSRGNFERLGYGSFLTSLARDQFLGHHLCLHFTTMMLKVLGLGSRGQVLSIALAPLVPWPICQHP